MKKLTVLMCLAVAVSLFAADVFAGKVVPTTNLIVGRPAKGMYCADPAGWINAGYNGANGIYVWNNGTPVKAQDMDANGLLLLPSTGMTYTVPSTGQTGPLTLTDATNKVYTATPTSVRADLVYSGNPDTAINYTADGKTFPGVIRRWNAKCDGCHATPPAHAIANKATTVGISKCRDCHALGDRMKTSHWNRVPNNTTSQACYSCHPSPCYSGIHTGKFPGDSIGCISCHGDLTLAPLGQMKVPGQLGFPRCEGCHVSVPNQPVPYAQNPGVEYKSSTGHGRRLSSAPKVLCITCHNSMHMETKPMSWGDGVNNNCEGCHKNMPTANNMGDVCGNCHVNSMNPHLVVK